jgi:hypothetical protein
MGGMAQPPSACPPLAKPAIRPEAASSVSTSTMNATNGSALERQLDALLTPTTIADLARQGGSIKTMKERELRELIRHALLTLMQSSTSVAAPDQEQLLDQVQGELQRTLAATAAERAEQEALRAELAHTTTAMGNLSLRLAEAEQAAATLRAEVLAAQSEAAMPGAPEPGRTRSMRSGSPAGTNANTSKARACSSPSPTISGPASSSSPSIQPPLRESMPQAT